MEQLNDKPQPSIINKLLELPVVDENAALNILVGFIDIAQKRGVYNLEESHKIWECIKKFQVKKDV
jgi:hypothetical protein